MTAAHMILKLCQESRTIDAVLYCKEPGTALDLKPNVGRGNPERVPNNTCGKMQVAAQDATV